MASRLKDPFCSISHWVGFGLALIGAIALIANAIGRPLYLASYAIYGLGMMGLYFASALYHSVQRGSKLEYWLQKLDHSAIYLMIAGSYVPVCLIALRGVWGWGMLAAQAAFAVTGIILTFKLKKVPGLIRVILYVSMGWMAVFVLGPMRSAMPPGAILWLFAGGIVYTIGAVVYVSDRPHLWPGKFSAHDLWHLFVMGGSACHYVMIARFLVPT